jgi:hypothetical protein
MNVEMTTNNVSWKPTFFKSYSAIQIPAKKMKQKIETYPKNKVRGKIGRFNNRNSRET